MHPLPRTRTDVIHPWAGDDIPEIRDAVKSALQACCMQLKIKLLLAAARRERAGRKKLLVRYVPDVCRAVLAALGK